MVCFLVDSPQIEVYEKFDSPIANLRPRFVSKRIKGGDAVSGIRQLHPVMLHI